MAMTRGAGLSARLGAKVVATLLLALACAMVRPAVAAECQNTGSFETWLDRLKQDAAGAGISQRTLSAALAGISLDPAVVSRDRNQKVFRQTFEQFSARMV